MKMTEGMRRKVHKFRVATKPVAFRIFRYGLVGTAVCFAAGAAFTEELRIIMIRCFCAFFGSTLSGFFVHFAAITVDEVGCKRYGTAVWMAVWTVLLGFLIFSAMRIAMQGF
jgi:hypothetical protein